MKTLIYLIGFAFIFTLYGMFVAITSNFYVLSLNSTLLFYCVRAIEVFAFLWFAHRFLKITVYEGKGIGEAFIETFNISNIHLNKRTDSNINLKVVNKQNFDGSAEKKGFDFILSQIHPSGNYSVELYRDERIVKLNIPFSEIFCRCSKKEWGKIEVVLKSVKGKF